MAVRRKNSTPRLDRVYPFPVTLAADECGGSNIDLLERVCETLTVQPQIRSVLCAHRGCLLFCFASDADAQTFYRIFGGEYFVAKVAGEIRSTCAEFSSPSAIH